MAILGTHTVLVSNSRPDSRCVHSATRRPPGGAALPHVRGSPGADSGLPRSHLCPNQAWHQSLLGDFHPLSPSFKTLPQKKKAINAPGSHHPASIIVTAGDPSCFIYVLLGELSAQVPGCCHTHRRKQSLKAYKLLDVWGPLL